jgi:hypothetical protein
MATKLLDLLASPMPLILQYQSSLQNGLCLLEIYLIEGVIADRHEMSHREMSDAEWLYKVLGVLLCMLTFEEIDRFRAVDFVVRDIEDRLFPEGDAAQAAGNQHILVWIWRNRHDKDEATLITEWLFFGNFSICLFTTLRWWWYK